MICCSFLSAFFCFVFTDCTFVCPGFVRCQGHIKRDHCTLLGVLIIFLMYVTCILSKYKLHIWMKTLKDVSWQPPWVLCWPDSCLLYKLCTTAVNSYNLLYPLVYNWCLCYFYEPGVYIFTLVQYAKFLLCSGHAAQNQRAVPRYSWWVHDQQHGKQGQSKNMSLRLLVRPQSLKNRLCSLKNL